MEFIYLYLLTSALNSTKSLIHFPQTMHAPKLFQNTAQCWHTMETQYKMY